tara:strand:- start:28 stop:579 length:552 start_codon:yes stop_codon:yes gene_type:complete
MNIYTHKHHILPRHAGGTDDPSNIVELTVEEHAEAHRKLYEEHGRWQDKLAWKGLAGQIGKEEIIRNIQRENGKRVGALPYSPRKIPLVHTEEARKRISEARTGSVQSEETKKKRADKLRGRKNTPETITKMSISASQRVYSDEAKKSFSNAAKNREKVVCPQCGKRGDISAMKRHHFSNCRW